TRWGGSAVEGNLLTMQQIRGLDEGVPLRMAPLVYAGTIVTHLLGGSAGREGTALQMAAGLTDGLAARLRVRASDRRLLLTAALGLGVWLLKLVMTSLTVGSGFAGGEVTPLFVIGATLGAALGHTFGGPVVLLAAVGMMATFGSAVNASLACVVMGVELFGWG